MDHYAPEAVKGLPPEYHRILNKYAYQSNDATNVVDLTVGILSHNGLKYEAFTYRENKDSNRTAGDIERLITGVIKMNCIEQETDLHNDIIHNMTVDSGCAVRSIWIDTGEIEEVQSVPEAPLGQEPQSQSVAVIKGNPLRLDVIPLYNMIWYGMGIPLGISEEYLRFGQEHGMWIVGAFMASFGLVGAVLTLGLTQRWGEVFPRWMIGLAGRRVPIALAVVPASVVSVLLVVGGIAMWSGYAQMVAESLAGGTENISIIAEAPTTLFPLWGVALAVATLGYYYRRRGPCNVCGRGTSSQGGEPSTSYQSR